MDTKWRNRYNRAEEFFENVGDALAGEDGKPIWRILLFIVVVGLLAVVFFGPNSNPFTHPWSWVCRILAALPSGASILAEYSTPRKRALYAALSLLGIVALIVMDIVTF